VVAALHAVVFKNFDPVVRERSRSARNDVGEVYRSSLRGRPGRRVEAFAEVVERTLALVRWRMVTSASSQINMPSS
jgi:hypothetical protein